MEFVQLHLAENIVHTFSTDNLANFLLLAFLLYHCSKLAHPKVDPSVALHGRSNHIYCIVIR